MYSINKLSIGFMNSSIIITEVALTFYSHWKTTQINPEYIIAAIKIQSKPFSFYDACSLVTPKDEMWKHSPHFINIDRKKDEQWAKIEV